jgi:LysR family transcriptional activator of nhaA
VEATATHRGRATRLRVGMLPWIPRSLLYETLRPALATAQGPVRGPDGGFALEVTVADLAGLCNALVTGRLHVALSDRLPTRAGDTPVHGQIVGQLIGESRISFYGTQRLVQRHQPDFPRSLDGAPLLLPATGTTLREGLASWFAEEGIRPRVVGEFDDLPTMQGFAARGHGLVPLRQSLAEDVRLRYGLWPVGPVPGLKDRFYTLTLGRRMRHPGVQPLVDEWRHRLRR